ncbi:MAG: trimeric intracellular cation channel family protein [Gemmatimonadaceae bacterium]
MLVPQNVIDIGTTAGLRAVEISAVILSALSGIIVAAKKRMDLVGTYALAVVTAFGGGTVRDILLDRRPLFWVTYWQYLVVVLALCIVFVYSRRAYESAGRWQRRFDVLDAIGLGLFALSGAHMALQHGMPLFIATIYGVITASVGGILRDVLSSEIPVIFRGVGALHASAVFIGCVGYVGLLALGANELVAGSIGFVAIVALRLSSIWLGFGLPKPHWLRTLQRTGEYPTSSS